MQENECWAIVGSSSTPNRKNLISVLLSTVRAVPRPIYSFEGAEGQRKHSTVQLIGFNTRPTASGAFQDHSARYFSIRDEDQLTVRQHLEAMIPTNDADQEGGHNSQLESDLNVVLATSKKLQMDHLLEVPFIVLSNGQTRRLKIIAGLLKQPQFLILEEPYTGLDVASRATLSSLLAELHSSKSPRILFVLRPQDVIPPCVTHVAIVGEQIDEEVTFVKKDEMMGTSAGRKLLALAEKRVERVKRSRPVIEDAEVLVSLMDVRVNYVDRVVLDDVNWSIREGQRSVLKGHNGSGKSTLLSLVLGDHPSSFVIEGISLFGKPRIAQATSTIQQKIGHVSPEIFTAFPRRYNSQALTVDESIATGFNSIYCYRKLLPSQQEQLDRFITRFDHPLFTREFRDRNFADLTHGQQSLVLLLRALVHEPLLLVLDEPFAGMDESMVNHAKAFLDDRLHPRQAVILISHYEEEIPETFDSGIELSAGQIVARW